MKIITLALLAAFAATNAMAAGKMSKVARLSASPTQYYDKTVCVKGSIASSSLVSGDDGLHSVLTIADATTSVPAVAKGNGNYIAGNDIIACGKFRAQTTAGTQTLVNAITITSASQKTPSAKPKTKKIHATKQSVMVGK